MSEDPLPMPELPSPVVVIPGITASDLHDEYELPPEAVWTTVRTKRHERIALHPADQRYELIEPARVAPRGPFPLVYEELIEELRDGLSEDQDGPVPVFPFGYDWRLPLDRTEERLAAFVHEVIDRTLLMEHYRDSAFADAPAVTLIGHSMGGLVIAGYLERHGAALVDKVVTLGTPFQGSHEAVLAIATGTSDLADDSGKARERRTARMTPALYHLLPGFAGALAVDEGVEDDIFSPAAWQPNVLRTIERQVAGWEVSGDRLFARMLDQARAHRERISGLALADGEAGDGDDDHALLDRRDWLAVAGVDSKTRVRLRIRRDASGAPRFDLRSDERLNRWDPNDPDPALRRGTGDGTVPLEGAIPPFLGRVQRGVRRARRLRLLGAARPRAVRPGRPSRRAAQDEHAAPADPALPARQGRPLRQHLGAAGAGGAGVGAAAGAGREGVGRGGGPSRRQQQTRPATAAAGRVCEPPSPWGTRVCGEAPQPLVLRAAPDGPRPPAGHRRRAPPAGRTARSARRPRPDRPRPRCGPTATA